MKITQNNFVKSLPKIIIFGIAFYNFFWIVWQNSKGCSGIACPWYFSNSFPIEAFLLLIAAYLLFIQHWMTKTISILLSGYFSFVWIWMLSSFIQKNGLSEFRNYLQTFSFNENPLEIWEIQIVIALIIFGLAIYNLKKVKTTQILA